jgi:hypothetical protein
LQGFKHTLDDYVHIGDGSVLKQEKLSYVKSNVNSAKKLKDNEYLVSLSSEVLKLENNEFETILWSEKIPDNYYLRTPRYFSGDYIIRVPVASDQ